MKKRTFLLLTLCIAGQSLLAQRQLDSVLIKANLPAAKQDLSINLIYPTEEDRQPAKEIPYLLELMPSIVSYSDNGTGMGSSSFRIRGTDPSRTNISIDGIPLNDAESQTVFWVNIPSLGAMAKRITIQRGAGSAAFGTAAFGGAMDIGTGLASAKPFVAFNGYYGSFNSWNTAVSLGSGDIFHGLSMEADYSRTGSDGYLERSSANQQSARLAASWRGKTQALKATLLYGEQHTMLTFEGVPYDSLATNRRYNASGLYYDSDGREQFYDNETDNYTQTHLHLHYLQELGNYWNLNSAIFYTKGLGYYEQYKGNASLSRYGIPDQVINGTNYRRSDIIRRKGLDNDYYGINLSTDYNNSKWQFNLSAGASRYIGDHIGKILWVKHNAGGIEYNRHWYENTGTKSELNSYAKIAYNINKNFSIYGNLQYKYINFKLYGEDDDHYERPLAGFLDTTFHWHFLNPQLGLQFTSDNHRAYASFALVNREPNRSDLKDADKNGIRIPPQAERLYDWEVGYANYGEFASIGLNLYYMNYRNQIVATGQVNDAYRAIMTNIPESYRMGIELFATARLSSAIELEGNLTLSRNKLKDYTNYVDEYADDTQSTWLGQREEHFSDVDIAYSPNIIGAVTLRLKPFSGLRLSVTGKYVSDQYYDNTASEERKIDAYFPFNFNADYNFTFNNVNCFIQLAVNNIFNLYYSSSAFVNYRAVFADGSPDFQDRRFFPQATTNIALKLGIKL
ncbi:MAG: TonB-dependent receptor plug domain-containing protein [Bacteroidales bacterium]|nr:TonB-dependent receptor plug domain-containing protein [Bacteroidales bacterium]